MPVSEYVTTATEGMKKFWNDFDIKKWSEQIGGSSAEAVEAALYFCLSFSIGFLFKKYFRFVFTCLIITLFTIKLLEYNQFLVIDWTAIKLFFGVTEAFDFNVMINTFFAWIKTHLLLFIASTVGFLVGYKLG